MKDQAFAERLHADLQDSGIRCWFAPHDIRAGSKIHEQIGDAIHLHDRLLVILSANSMNSEWVKTEIAYARKREIDERRQVLFPIVSFRSSRCGCGDADAGKDSARELSEYFIPDFSDWKDEHSHQRSFQRLLTGLAW